MELEDEKVYIDLDSDEDSTYLIVSRKDKHNFILKQACFSIKKETSEALAYNLMDVAIKMYPTILIDRN
jgi:hypothetical protein